MTEDTELYHGGTEPRRYTERITLLEVACGPPAFGGPDERGQRSKYKRLEIVRALGFRSLISFVPRVTRRHRPLSEVR